MPKQIKLIKIKSSKRNSLLKLVFTLLIIYFFVLFCSQQISINRLNRQQNNLENQITEQQVLNEDIEKQLTEESKLERVEKIARDELGYLKTNERLFIDASSN